jgi:hypothetical protein
MFSSKFNSKASGAFAIGTEYTNGQPWRTQYAFNTLQTGALGPWSTEANYLGNSASSRAVVTKNKVYLLGISDTASCYVAPIDTNGIVGTFVLTNSLPGPIYGKDAWITSSRVYLAGGYNNTAVYYAPIDANGNIGTWTTGPATPAINAEVKAIITRNRVYLLGGTTGISYTATVDSNGIVGSWSTAATTPGATSRGISLVSTGTRVYKLGGGNTGGENSQYATFGPDGILGAWTVTNSLAGPVPGRAQAVITHGRCFIMGGYDNAPAYTSRVQSAPVDANGVIGTWANDVSGVGSAEATVFTTSSRIYVMGGSYKPATCFASFLGGSNDYTNKILGV